MEDYVATGSPLDKAGGYGIQDDRGALFVSRIRGDFYNVMGLPIRRLYRLLKSDFEDWIEFSGPMNGTSN
jgi:septum formation protein